MLADLRPMRRAAARDAIVVAHFAALGVYSIMDLLRHLVPCSGKRTAEQFSEATGLSVELGVVYLLDLVRELGSVDRLLSVPAGPGSAGGAAVARTYVALIKRQLLECAELTAYDAAHPPIDEDEDQDDEGKGKKEEDDPSSDPC
jgi:hypothetical protein